MTQREITNGDILQALGVVPILYLPSWAHPIDADVLDVLLQSQSRLYRMYIVIIHT